MTLTPRQRLKALSQGRGDGRGIAIPLAARFAARINERDWDDFTFDPTQLANGMRDLIEAVHPDGVQVTLPDALAGTGVDLQSNEHLPVAIEATSRLRTSMGERVALLACLPDPSAFTGGSTTLIEIAKQFLAAGADAILIVAPPDVTTSESLTSMANIARFHQALALSTDSRHGLQPIEEIALAAPRRGSGVAVTEADLPRDINLDMLEQWVHTVRG